MAITKQQILEKLWLKKWSVRAKRVLQFAQKNNINNIEDLIFFNTSDKNFTSRAHQKKYRILNYQFFGAEGKGNFYCGKFVAVKK